MNFVHVYLTGTKQAGVRQCNITRLSLLPYYQAPFKNTGSGIIHIYETTREQVLIIEGYSSSPGFSVNSAVLQAVVSRYADAQYAIDFDSFVGCLIKLESLFSKCQQTLQYHFSTSHTDLCDLRAVYITTIFDLPLNQKYLRLWKDLTERSRWICNRCVRK